jgi:hypothetical protein
VDLPEHIDFYTHKNRSCSLFLSSCWIAKTGQRHHAHISAKALLFHQAQSGSLLRSWSSIVHRSLSFHDHDVHKTGRETIKEPSGNTKWISQIPHQREGKLDKANIAHTLVQMLTWGHRTWHQSTYGWNQVCDVCVNRPEHEELRSSYRYRCDTDLPRTLNQRLHNTSQLAV